MTFLADLSVIDARTELHAEDNMTDDPNFSWYQEVS